MHIPSDDEIARFFDSIAPEDFLSAPETTALFVEDEDYARHGAEEFDRFVLAHLAALAKNESPGVVLHNGSTARTYLPTEEENLAEFLGRASKEVESFGGKWVFIGVPGEASLGEMFDPSSTSDIESARRKGKLIDVINWYAESIEPTSEEVRFGIIFHQDGEQRIVQSTFDNGANPAFRRVLRTRR